MPKPPRIWIVTELYYPEDGATGHLLTQIAEGLASEAEVHVLCTQPSYTQQREKSPRVELHRGVHIKRCRTTSFSKDRLVLRVINMLTILISFSWNMVSGLRRQDRVLVVTNPPPLPFAAWLACRLRGAKCVLLIHDIYPDVLVPTKFTRQNSILYRVIDWFFKRLLLGVDRIITIGRDMQQRVLAKSDRLSSKTTVITNWCDQESIWPIAPTANPLRAELDLTDKFVILYSGNMGRTHGLETIAAAAQILEDAGHEKIHWLVCGGGGGKKHFAARCQQLNLKSVTVRDFFPREQLVYSLNCGDVAIISFIPGMSGISVPSRMYNFFAAGRPIIGVTEAESELALTIREFELGWVVEPEQPQLLADQVLEIFSHRDRLATLGERCRAVALAQFSRERAIALYRDVFV